MTQPTSPKRRPWLFLMGMAVIVATALPWVLAKTTLRDRLLNTIVNSDDITITSTNASLGYFTPLSLSGLQIRSKDEATKIEVENIQADGSWLGMLFSRPELGTFRFDNPKIDVLVDPEKLKANANQAEDEQAKRKSGSAALPNLAAEINDASIVVRTTLSTEPPIDLQHIQLKVRLEQQAAGSVLRVDPATVFDHQRITPELCGQGLQLIAPLLADEVDAEGEFSLRLEQCEIPIGLEPEDQKQHIHLKGELQLHQASVGLKNTIAKGVSDLVLKLIGIGAPDRLTVAKDLVVSFQVVDGRVRHEGLALLLPHGESSIEFMSSGSVGLDETLDLKVSVKLPDELLAGSALVQRLTKEPIVLAITGKLDAPKVELASNSGLIKSIQGLINGDAPLEVSEESLNETISGAADVVGGLLEGLRKRAEQRQESTEADPGASEESSARPGLRERLRDRPLLRNRREATPEPDPPAPDPPAPDPPAPPPPAPPEPIDL